MYVIKNITDNPKQKQTLNLPDGSQVKIEYYFCLRQLGWFITKMDYANGTFILNNLRISNSPNMLHQFRNQIPFGLACFSKDNREPSLIQDFSSGNSVLYILSAAEVAQYTRFLSGSS